MWSWFTYDDDDGEEETKRGPSQQEQEKAQPSPQPRGGKAYDGAKLDDLDPAVTAAILAQVLLETRLRICMCCRSNVRDHVTLVLFIFQITLSGEQTSVHLRRVCRTCVCHLSGSFGLLSQNTLCSTTVEVEQPYLCTLAVRSADRKGSPRREK